MDRQPSSLTWRPLAVGDARAAADLLNAMESIDQIGENYDEQDCLQELVDPYADLDRASLAAFDGDVMVGYMKTTWKPTAEQVHPMLINGGVHRSYRRHGVGTILLRAGVAAAESLHALHHPTLDLEVAVQKAEHIAGTAELFGAEAFTPTLYYQHLQHPLGGTIPATPIPDGFRIEPWSPHTDEQFRTIRNEAFLEYPGLLPMPVDNWKNRMTDQTFRPEASFLLRHDATGNPVGMLLTKHWDADTATTGIRDAHFILIGTLRDYRRRGVASALIGHALRAVADQGYDQASTRVDSAQPSGATGIYDQAGFTLHQRHVHWTRQTRRLQTCKGV